MKREQLRPQEFCSAPGYDAFLALTFNADLVFFESVVLPQLWAGGTGEALVIADRGTLDESLPRQGTRLRHLGRRYALDAPRGWGRQHAKVLLRLGKAGALLWVGSGNLSAGGWGGNQELATAWRVERGDTEGMADVQRVLRAAHGLSSGRVHDALGRWLEDGAFTGRSAAPRLLLSGPGGGTLATQLAARWTGRRFQRARMLTGSTDEQGALLGWLHRTFGVEEATVAVDPRLSDFDAVALEALPLTVNIVPLPPKPRSHAKLLLLEGPDGSAALMGSANCSAAAWLTPAAQGGNVEAVVVYDGATEEDLGDCLEAFAHPSLAPRQAGLKGPPARTESPETEVEVALVELRLDAVRGEVRARIEPPLAGTVAAHLLVGELRTPLHPAAPDGCGWVGPVPDLPPSGGTHLGRVVLTLDGHEVQSGVRWLDVEQELDAWRTRRGAAALVDLARRPARRSEYARIREEVAELAAAILSGRDGLSEPAPAKRPATATAEETVAADPDQLLRSLSEARADGPVAHHERHVVDGLALGAIVRAVFPPMEAEADVESEAELEDEDAAGGHAPPGGGAQPPEAPPQGAQTPDVPPEDQRKRFATWMEDYFKRLAAPDFATQCTARQLVEAVSLPLAISARALTGRWMDAATAHRWVMRTEELLLQVDTEVGGPEARGGLLEAVRVRYAAEGRSNTFDQVVGDGTLWAALAGALLQVSGSQPELERALALREVFDEPLLMQRAQPLRLAQLVGVADGADHLRLLERAQAAAHAVRALEALLREEALRLKDEQNGQKAEKGDLVWHPILGFGRAQDGALLHKGAKVAVQLRRRRSAGKVLALHLVNVRLAAQTSVQINECLELAERCSLMC